MSRTLRCVLASARHPLLGRDFCSARMSAASRSFAAQRVVSLGRHSRGCRGNCRAYRLVPARPHCFPFGSGSMGCHLRTIRDAAAQLRGLRGCTVRLHRGDHREQPTGRRRRTKWRGIYACHCPYVGDRNRHRLRRPCSGRYRSWRCATPAGSFIGRPVGRNRQPVHGGFGGCGLRSLTLTSHPARSDPAHHRTRPRYRRGDRRIFGAPLSFLDITKHCRWIVYGALGVARDCRPTYVSASERGTTGSKCHPPGTSRRARGRAKTGRARALAFRPRGVAAALSICSTGVRRHSRPKRHRRDCSPIKRQCCYWGWAER